MNEELPHRHCFTYCGDEACTCPAKEFHSTLEWIAPALPVLETMCRTAGFHVAAEKAGKMRHDVAFLLEAARYFENRPTGGEDSAYWANVYNAENCRRIAARLARDSSRGRVGTA